MARKIKKKDVDQHLLNTLFNVEYEWKQIQSIIEKSIEPTVDGNYWEAVTQAKYLYLLREVRHRNLNAKDYARK